MRFQDHRKQIPVMVRLLVGKILATDKEKGAYLIDANGLFLSETFTRIKRPRFPGQSPFAFSLGRFDKGKSKINEIKNYPENTNVKN